MSTYWYYECMDHSPPLRSGDEFTQHTDDEWFRQGVDMAKSRPQPEDDGSYWSSYHLDDYGRARLYFRMNALKFLYFHPTCHLRFVNEYGDYWPDNDAT